jgi:uncharacterized protein with beta-barrel porin domain
MDYQINPHLLWGLATGLGAFGFDVPDRSTSGTIEATHFAGYVAARNDNAYATAMLDFDFFENQETRNPSIPGSVLPLAGGPLLAPGLMETDKGNFASYGVSGQAEAGYRFRARDFNVTPFVGVEFSQLAMNGFSETGTPGNLALSFAPQNVWSVPGYIGAQIDGNMLLSGGRTLNAWLRGQWMHDFETDRPITPSFVAAPGFGFTVFGAPGATDIARIGTGVKLSINKYLSFDASLNTDLYKTPSYSGTVGVRAVW